MTDNINEEAFYKIDSTNLTEEYAQQVSRYVKLVRLSNQAEREATRAKAAEERAYAAADEFYREDLSKQGTKFTETMIKSLVTLDEDYITAQEAAADAQNRYLLYKQLVRAMEMRSDMLISMGAHQRAEISMTGMKVKEKEYDDVVSNVRQSLQNAKHQV